MTAQTTPSTVTSLIEVLENSASRLLSERKLAEVIRGADVNGATLLKEAFLRSINTANMPAWQVRAVLDGVRVPPHHYEMSKMLKVAHTHIIDRGYLNRLFARGATVMIDDAQSAIPDLATICDSLSDATLQSVAGTIFASPPHAEGFALHQDAEDVIIFQLHGAKTWMVFPPVERSASSMMNRSESSDPLFETDLVAGDILLLPKGSPHKTASNSRDGSLHLTLGFYPVTMRDLLSEILSKTDDPRLDNAVTAETKATDVAEILRLRGSDKTESIQSAFTRLRRRLIADESAFSLISQDERAGGGTYKLLNRVNRATQLFLASQLGREDDPELEKLVAYLTTLTPGQEFKYVDFAAATGDPIISEEVLHEMLRMRFVVHSWDGSA